MGIAVHSRYVTGEDRMIELHRDASRWNLRPGFSLVVHGSSFTGGAEDHPSPGWAGAAPLVPPRLRTELEPGRVRVQAKAIETPSQALAGLGRTDRPSASRPEPASPLGRRARPAAACR